VQGRTTKCALATEGIVITNRLLAVASSASIVVLGGTGCGNRQSGESIEFTRAAMKSVPSMSATGTTAQALTFSASPGTLSAALALATGTIADYPDLVNLFRKECQHLPNDNYCPPTVHPTTDLMDPTRFEMGSLIGIIYHAQMYGGSLYTKCSGDGLSPTTVSAGSYAAADATNALADPTRFVLDQFSLYTCRSSNVSDSNAETRVVSAVGDGSYQAALHTRFNYLSPGQTDFFQVYVSMQAGSPEVLAFNFSAATPHASRIVLLTNLTNHRFALKYYVPLQGAMGAALYVVATGVGGYDLSTGNDNPGYYVVSFSMWSGRTTLCVNNVGAVVQPDTTSCTASSVPTAWTSSDAIASYLGIPASDTGRIAAFLAMFADDAPLTANDAWQNPGDENLYWPATLH
jgi:hypothetical protein